MPSIALLGGCCGCDVDTPECAVVLRARDCGNTACGDLDADPGLDYELYYPAGAASATCAGSLAPAGPGLYESPACPLSGFSGCAPVRARIVPTDARYRPIDRVITACCYYPANVGTIEVLLEPAEGYLCRCGPNPHPPWTSFPALTLTTAHGSVTVTNNTPGVYTSASPSTWVGDSTVAADPTGVCVVPSPDRARVCPGSGAVPVHWRIVEQGCHFTLIGSYWEASVVGTADFDPPTCAPSWIPRAIEACNLMKAAGCVSPYYDCSNPLGNLRVPTPYPVNTSPPAACHYPGTFSVYHFSPNTAFGAVCTCLSADPLLYECVYPAVSACENNFFYRYSPFKPGDTWTLSAAV